MFTDEDRSAADIAERQSGAIHRSTLRSVGFTDPMIRRRLASGQLDALAPSVYRFAGTPDHPTTSMVAQALSVDPKAAVSHDSAAHFWQMIGQQPREVHTVVRRWRREHRVKCLVHESLDFVPRDRVWVDGVPVTVPHRTVVDLGATSPWLVERALSAGIRSELFSVADVEGFVDRVARRGRSGVGIIRPYLALHSAMDGPTESFLEDRFLRVLYEREIALPVTQFVVEDRAGHFVCRSDFAYPRERLLIELDGRAYHSDSVAFQADRRKQNRTQALGWATLRFTWSDVVREPDRTANTVDSWLERATQPVLA